MKIKKIHLILMALALILLVNPGNSTKSSENMVFDSTQTDHGLSLSQSDQPYSRTGTINENGDEYWDSTEFDIIQYVIPAGEEFEAELYTDSGAELFIFYGDFDDEVDIDNAVVDIIDYGDSSRLIVGDVTVNGYAFISYTPSSQTDKNVAISSYNTSNPSSMGYTLFTSIEAGSGSSSSSSTLWIVVAIGAIIIFLIYRSGKKKKTGQTYQKQGYQDSTYQQPQQSYQQTGYQQPKQSYQTDQSTQRSYSDYDRQPVDKNTADVYCSNCGSANSNIDNFCINCGTKL